MSKLALVQVIAFGSLNDARSLQDVKNYVVATMEVADNLQACSSVVLVVRTAGEHDNIHTDTEK